MHIFAINIRTMTCTLCNNEIFENVLTEENRTFCCSGCHAVYTILSTRNQLEGFQDHPIFRQALKSGLISNPALFEQMRKKNISFPEEEMQKLHLEILDMWCPSCAELIRLILLQEKGISNCVIDYSTDLASIEFSPRYFSKEKIFQLIESFGYQPMSLDSQQRSYSFSLWMRFIISAFCSLNIMMFSYPLYATYFYEDPLNYGSLFAWLSLFTSIPVLTYCAWPIYKKFSLSIQAGRYGMETLVILSVFTGFLFSLFNLLQGGIHVYFDSLTVIITFMLLGKMIEAKAKFSAKETLLLLTRSCPKKGRKKHLDGSCSFVPLKDIQVGDIIIAHSGEKIVLDGAVIEGQGTCDESLMTGEAIPIVKSKASKVIGGSILQCGSIEFEVTSTFEDSALQRIIYMVQENLEHKTSYFRAADHVVKWFVPIVLGIASLAMAFYYWHGENALETVIARGMSILLIACPCAIGIAVPLAEAYVIRGIAHLGAIVRNRGALSLFGKETIYIFDKTGTVTEGQFEIVDGLESLHSEQLALLKSLTSHSSHLISTSIYKGIDSAIPILNLENFVEVIGKGIMASYQGQQIYLGSKEFLLGHGMAPPQVQKLTSYSSVYFSIGQLCVLIQLGDRIRSGIQHTLMHLNPMKKILLSGDTEEAVSFIAKECGFDSWVSKCSPLQKREYIEMLRKNGECVCMVGDGINDAPALTSANIGFATMSATDLSIQVSDFLITTHRLEVIPKIRKLAVKGNQIIKQNLFWAFFYNIIGIGIAFFGYLSPIFAAFAMVSSSLIVLFNAKRIRIHHREIGRRGFLPQSAQSTQREGRTG